MFLTLRGFPETNEQSLAAGLLCGGGFGGPTVEVRHVDSDNPCVSTEEVAFPKTSRTIPGEQAYYVPDKVCDFDLTLGQMSWVKNKRATKKQRNSRV
jgi:hypothetical protein